MPNIKLLQPNSLDEAAALLGTQPDEAKIISGGTALVIMLKNRLIAPTTLLSLGRLQELRSIRHEADIGLRIGALVTLREAEQSPIIRAKNPRSVTPSLKLAMCAYATPLRWAGI
jgi:carbon-monoxide dehydrogenase medium subunit